MAALIELKDLADAIRATSDCLKGLADSIAHVIRLSAEGYDEVVARRQEAALRGVRAQLIDLTRAQGIGLTALDRYAMTASHGAKAEGLSQEWQRVMRGLEECLRKALAVFEDTRRLRGDFFLEKDYERLMDALGSRITLFERLLAQDPPTSAEELALLKQASAEWRRLLQELRSAAEALRSFLQDRANGKRDGR